MTTKVDEIKVQLADLSVDELLTVMEQINTELRHRVLPNGKTPTKPVEQEPENKPYLPGTYRISKAEVEASLKARYTTQELEEMAKVDLSKLPPLPKSISEIISEDREDRI